MPFYAVIGLDHPPHSGEKRLAQRDAHRGYVVTHDQDIALVGPLLDSEDNPCGSFYLFEAESEQVVRDWLAREPYAQGEVYRDLIVRRFELGKSRMPAQDWPIARLATPEK